MSRILTVFLTIMLLLVGQLSIAATSYQDFLDMVTRFDKADYDGKVDSANEIMSFLDEEEFADHPIRFTQHTPSDSLLANVWYWVGEYVFDQGEYKRSLEYILKSLPSAEKIEDVVLLCNVYSRLSVIYTREGNYGSAIDYAQKVLDLDRESGNKSYISSDLGNIAAIYLSSRQASKALPFALEAIENSTAAKDSARMAIQHGLASEIYHSMGHNSTALNHAKTAYDIDMSRGNEGKAAIRLCQMASAMIPLGQFEEALNTLTRAIPVLEKVGNKQSFSIAYNQLGNIYLEKGDEKRAADCFEKALPFFREQGDIYNESNSLEGLYVALSQSNPHKAMQHLKRFCSLKDSLYNNEMQKKLSEYDARYNNEKLRSAYAEQKARQALVTSVLIAIIAIMIALVIVLNSARKLRIKIHLLELEQAEMKDRFFTNITHEFRTHLSVIQMGAQQIMKESGGNDPDDIRHHAEIIRRQGKSLLGLVNQLLDTAKLSSSVGSAPDWVNADLAELVKISTDSMSVMASKRNVSIVADLPDDGLPMDMVMDYMQKIILNLLSNAVKFSPEGSVVHIRAANVGRIIKMEVADSGCGLTEEQKSHLFEAFYQAPTESRRIGTGIGLSLVKLCTDAMNGTIEVESEPGRGTIFLLTFPLSCGHEVAKAEVTIDIDEIPDVTKPEAADYPSDNVSSPDLPVVVIAEDSPEVAGYLALQLKDKLNVVIATDGEQALHKTREVVPDMVVTDVMMPTMDGFELCRSIREDILLSHIPVIMVTAKSSDEDRLKGLEAGADAYLIKPFNPAELEVRVRKLMEQRRLLQQKYAAAVESGEEKTAVENDADRLFLEKSAEMAEQLLEEHCLDVSSFADKMCVSPRQLQRRISALTGDTPQRYIMRLRIRKAKELLENEPSASLADIAFRCGFEEPSSFSRTFKKFTEMTPTQYSKQFHVRS